MTARLFCSCGGCSSCLPDALSYPDRDEPQLQEVIREYERRPGRAAVLLHGLELDQRPGGVPSPFDEAVDEVD